MPFDSVKILGHLQSPSNELYSDFELQEFKGKAEWERFFRLGIPEAKRPHRVDFSVNKVIVFKTVSGQKTWIGLIHAQKDTEKTLMLSIDNLSFKRDRFGSNACYASYLFLSVHQTMRVKFQQCSSMKLLEIFFIKSDENTTASSQLYQREMQLNSMGLEGRQVQRKRDIRALNLSKKDRSICLKYLEAQLEQTKLAKEVQAEKQKLRLQLCGPDLKKHADHSNSSEEKAFHNHEHTFV